MEVVPFLSQTIIESKMNFVKCLSKKQQTEHLGKRPMKLFCLIKPFNSCLLLISSYFYSQNFIQFWCKFLKKISEIFWV